MLLIIVSILILVLFLNKSCINHFAPYDVPEKKIIWNDIRYNPHFARGIHPSLSKSISNRSPSAVFKDMLYIPKKPCY